MTKEAVLNSLKELPEEFELEELFERLLLLKRLEEAQAQVRRGETLPYDQVKKRYGRA